MQSPIEILKKAIVGLEVMHKEGHHMPWVQKKIIHIADRE
jgi:hypothetical protein